MTTQEPHVLYDFEDGIAQLTINRPKKLNALSLKAAALFNELFAQCDQDDAVRAIVVTGAGRAFSSGADLDAGKREGDAFAWGTKGGESRTARPDVWFEGIRPWDVRKPIIAAINGPAIGAGLTLALQYDIRIAAEDAKLSFAFSQRGVLPELGSTWVVPRLVGPARAMDLMLSGRTFLGKEAAEMGLVNEALPKDEVLPRAREIARYIATRAAPVSVAVAKRMIWQHLGSEELTAAQLKEAAVLEKLGMGPDAREGIMAFLQKRDPQWKMSPVRDMPDID